MSFSWLDLQFPQFSNQNLTIYQAARAASNPLDLKYGVIFPEQKVDSISLSSITLVDFRPAGGGRRDWNAQPREVPEKFGPKREFEMTPIEFSHHINEREMHKLREPGIQALVERGIVTALNRWPNVLADSVFRQKEVESIGSWFSGTIVVMDTKTSAVMTVSLGFDQATCYPAAGTAWDDPSEDAWENFKLATQVAYEKFGSVGGARMPRKVMNAIIAKAPDGNFGQAPTLSSTEARLTAEGFPNMKLIPDDRKYDKFTDGGSATTSTYFVPDGKIGFQPGDGRVGNTFVAPVVRAYDYLSGGHRELAQGIAVFKTEKNDGKTLMISAQENCLSMPEETRTYVVDTGIAR